MSRLLPIVATAILAALPARAAAECGGRSTNLCGSINDDREIFVGRALGTVDGGLEWTLHVVRSYRGDARGDIVVQVWSQGDLPSPGGLEVGESYLFYVSKTTENGQVVRTTPLACADWLPLSAVPREELEFLSHLSSRTNDGRIYGTLEHVDGEKPRPLEGIRISVTDGKKTYSGITDAKGAFEIVGLPGGNFEVTTSVPPNMLVEADTESTIPLAAHACVELELRARINTTVSGHVMLPAGYTVVGTEVFALTPEGKPVKQIYADPEGRYTIPGLPPGEYVFGIGIARGGVPTGVDAPFLPTYAPGTTNIRQATRIAITGPETFDGVDIPVVVAPIATIPLKAAFEDGRPAADAYLTISFDGYGDRGVGRTDEKGQLLLRIVKGTRIYLLGGTQRGGCIPPTPIGPDTYPETIEATLSPDACREQSNLTTLGVLQSRIGGPMGRMTIRVTLADGTPAYKAEVFITSHSAKPLFSGGFQSDREGRLELPTPLNEEFVIHASLTDGGRSCRSDEVKISTRDGVPKGETALPLKGAGCGTP